jgi:hypothetical protein
MKSFIACLAGVVPYLVLVNYVFCITISQSYGMSCEKWIRNHLEDSEVIILSMI